MMRGIDLIYKINGDVDKGISVFDLSPVLLSVGTIIKESYKELFPYDEEIAINIKPFGKGSFEIDILMFARDVFQEAMAFIKSDTGQNITWVLAYLGYTSQFSGINFIQLISLLKGKKIESVEQLEAGEVTYHADDNTSITVVDKVDRLYQNCTIQNNIYAALGRPLEIPSVTSIESFLKQEEQDTKVTYRKDISQSLKEYSSKAFLVEKPEEVIENERILWVHPVKANLEGGQKSWSFRIGRDETLTAHISDEKFLKEVRNNRIRLANADRLKVKIIQKQKVTASEIVTTNEIVEIEQYVKGPEQRTLF